MASRIPLVTWPMPLVASEGRSEQAEDGQEVNKVNVAMF